MPKTIIFRFRPLTQEVLYHKMSSLHMLEGLEYQKLEYKEKATLDLGDEIW
jgi:hypothetical protein